MCLCFVLFFKQKTAYEMRISDWSSDVCSSDLCRGASTGPRSSPPRGTGRGTRGRGGTRATRRPRRSGAPNRTAPQHPTSGLPRSSRRRGGDRKSGAMGKHVSVRGDIGGRRVVKKKKKKKSHSQLVNKSQ